MKQARVTLCNKLGLHARAASKLVQVASAHDCEVVLAKGDRRVNAKSIMGVLMLAAPVGSELLVECDGSDEDKALAALVALVQDRFGEDQ